MEENKNEQRGGGFNPNDESSRNIGNSFVQGNQEQFVQQPQLPNLRQVTQQYLDQQQQELVQPQTMQLPPPHSNAPEPVVAPSNQEASVKSKGMEGIQKEADVPEKHRPHWMKKNGKINKKEWRNRRFRKMLQPKNALMVLNELIGTTSYTVTETDGIENGTMFKCAIAIGELEHVGVAKSKPAAKISAAEAALKHIVLNKMKCAPPAELTRSTSLASEEKNEDDMSWAPIASYAIHSLLSSWNEGSDGLANSAESVTVVRRPSKKIPNSAASMNPLMLLNQMHPEAVYEEVGQFGNPPHRFFRMKCIVSDQTFIGVGVSKKEARKMCAFEACHKILGMEYSPEYLEEHGASKADLVD